MEKCTTPSSSQNPLGPLAGEKECLCLEVQGIVTRYIMAGQSRLTVTQ
jgi:hypothetical protein